MERIAKRAAGRTKMMYRGVPVFAAWPILLAMIAASISSAGAGLGQAAERHLDLSFRALASNAECSSEGFMRIMTGEPHPLANFAVVPPDLDAACVEIATEPLELKVPRP
ncbi:MAG: hypothetical protein R2748_16445 [Bryobacterales bacterium]